jgi:hypothetical protein
MNWSTVFTVAIAIFAVLFISICAIAKAPFDGAGLIAITIGSGVISIVINLVIGALFPHDHYNLKNTRRWH